MRRLAFAFLVAAGATAAPTPGEKKAYGGGEFIVNEGGLVLLRPDGREKARFHPPVRNVALSPDGTTLARLESVGGGNSRLILQPWGGRAEKVSVPEVQIALGEDFWPVWSPYGRRLLACEVHARSGTLEFRFRVYDVATKKLTDVAIPDGHRVIDWSKDGKRFLSTHWAGDTARLCWLPADGKGEPEYVTPEGESAWGGMLSPDGRRVLFQTRQEDQTHLVVMDLKTKKRVTLDEPGATHGYCWSKDGSAVAFTWQKTPVKGEENAERTTWLITCDADGRNMKKVTSRKRTPVKPGLHVAIFFEVIGWR